MLGTDTRTSTTFGTDVRTAPTVNGPAVSGPTVREILARKGSAVSTIPASITVLEAIHLMNDQKIGALVVVDEGRMTGIFTERDVLRRVVGEERAPSKVLVADVMTTDVLCCTPRSPIDEVSRLMKDHRVRHLPVCDNDGALLGIVSIGDINAYHASDQEATVRFLNEYICGRA